jgi:hypothetical protein
MVRRKAVFGRYAVLRCLWHEVRDEVHVPLTYLTIRATGPRVSFTREIVEIRRSPFPAAHAPVPCAVCPRSPSCV